MSTTCPVVVSASTIGQTATLPPMITRGIGIHELSEKKQMQTTDRGLRPYLYLKSSINDPLECTARDSTVYTPKEMKCID